MLKEHKNRIFNIINGAGLDLAYFQVLELDGIFQVQLRNSPIKFMFKQVPGSYDEFAINYTLFLPDYPLNISQENFESCRPYFNINGGIDNEFKYWLHAVVKRYINEIESPDLWLLFSNPFLFTSTSSISGEDLQPFTSEEKSQIKQRLLEFEDSVQANFDLLQEQLEFINERLEYLGNAVDRLNKFDWKAQALSTLISIAVNLSVDTEGGKRLFQLFGQAFDFIVKYLKGGI